MSVPLRGDRFEVLMSDFEAAARELVAPFEREPDLWARSLPGKWAGGQHVEHLAIAIAYSAQGFEHQAKRIAEGAHKPKPWRDPLQALFIFVVVRNGMYPKGAQAPKAVVPSASPDRATVVPKLMADVARHRMVGERLTAAQRDQAWVRNPFLASWHYTFSEILRVHAVHVRHHARGIREIAARS